MQTDTKARLEISLIRTPACHFGEIYLCQRILQTGWQNSMFFFPLKTQHIFKTNQINTSLQFDIDYLPAAQLLFRYF